jgi:4-hydroxybenzoate polyprenyltransferase
MVRLSPVLHLTRVTTAFAVIANTWFVILWTRANAVNGNEPGGAAGGVLEGPLWPLLGGGALLGLGLYAFGMTINDILDVRRDRLLRPGRPLASGAMGMDAAISLVVITLIASVLGATVFGVEAVLLTLLLHAAILAFNAAGKFIPGIGLVILGLIYGAHMVVPNLHLRFLWPVWLVMTHALVVRAVTHRMARRVPRLSKRAIVAAVVGWCFWSGVLLWFQWRRAGGHVWPEWVNPWAAVWPAALALLFALVAWRKVLRYGPGARAAEKIERYGSLWLPLYACGWLLGTEHRDAGLLLLGLAAAGLVGMTLLRELYGLLEQPVGYRR